MQPLNDVLKKFVREHGLEGGAVLNALANQWTGIVGEGIAAHTYPETVRNGTITLIVDSPQWMHHLGFYKQEIIDKLAQYDVKDVRFRHGRLPEKRRAAVREEVQDIELSDDDRTYIDNTLKNVDDEELKKTFEKLISHGLARGKKESE